MNKASSRCVVVKRRGFLTRKSQKKKLVCFRRSNSAYARIYARLKNWCFRDNKPPQCKPKKKQRDFSHLFLSSLFSLSFCSSSVFASSSSSSSSLSRSRCRCRCRFLEPRWSRRRRRRDRRIKEEHDGSRRWRNPIDDDRRKEKERRGNDVIYGRANESVPRAASISALARGRHRTVHALALALEDLDELPERALRERD